MTNTTPFNNKHFAVFGLGKAGIAAVRMLSEAGATIYAWDDNDTSRRALKLEELANVTIQPFAEYNWKEMDALVLSPGVPLTHPKPHEVVVRAQNANCPIICDVELLYRANPDARYVAITGTNGKSTTTSLIAHILKENGVDTEVGGNLGVAASCLRSLGKGGVYVIEMSSYQLDLIDQFHANVSVFLNITPDHLDRHGGLNGYIEAKCHIYDNQGKDDVAVIAVDDEHTSDIYSELQADARIETITPVSSAYEIECGVYVKDGVLHDTIRGLTIELGELIHLAGQHNAQNIAAAYAACTAVGVEPEAVIESVRSFAGLRHRLQYVGEVNSVRYINDSKATNADAASKALAAFSNIYWIAGGVAKEGGIASLAPLFKHVRKAFLIGQAQEDFAKILEGTLAFERCGDLQSALEQARKEAEASMDVEPVVLLSPACASFDQWPSFEARGDAFCKQVEQWQHEV
jgi:UDP-N-acetylmuramoylalanine--D-glutamate ligase